MPKTMTAALAAAFVLAWGPAAWATTEIYAKQGATAADEGKAIDDCLAKAKTAVARGGYINPLTYGATTPAAALAVSVVGGFMQGVHEAREQRRFEDRCMRKAGWGRIALTFAEDAEYQKTPEAQRLSWTDAFLKGDIDGRVKVALTPKVAPLPASGVEPAVGGVLFEPAALVAAEGPVGAGQPLLTGKVSHRRTAVLHEDVKIPVALGSLHVLKGTVYHQVELRAPATAAGDETSPLWCGKVKAVVAGTLDECFWTDFEGYHMATLQPTLVSESGYRDWLVGTPNFQQKDAQSLDGPLPLDVSDTDLIGPMDFTLKLDRIDKNGVWLAGFVSKDGKELPFWKGFVATDASGKAVAPFWTHRLTLMVQKDKATAAFTADGDGAGLADVPRTPPRKS